MFFYEIVSGLVRKFCREYEAIFTQNMLNLFASACPHPFLLHGEVVKMRKDSKTTSKCSTSNKPEGAVSKWTFRGMAIFNFIKNIIDIFPDS